MTYSPPPFLMSYHCHFIDHIFLHSMLNAGFSTFRLEEMAGYRMCLRQRS